MAQTAECDTHLLYVVSPHTEAPLLLVYLPCFVHDSSQHSLLLPLQSAKRQPNVFMLPVENKGKEAEVGVGGRVGLGGGGLGWGGLE